MKAMIMAAGVGSRLMPLTATIPKPMVPIIGKPVMQYGVELLKKHGITNIIANLHYLPGVITEHFKNGHRFGVYMNYSFEEQLLGTAGGVKNNQWFLDTETFVILSGDALTDIDLTKMYNFHKQKKALVTIALKPATDVTKFGVAVLDYNCKVVAFQEKPKVKEAMSSLVNTGIYMFEAEVFDYIPKNKFYDFGKELFPVLIEKGSPLYGWETSAYWSDIGSFDTYKEAQFDVINSKVSVNIDSFYLRGESIIRGIDSEVGSNISLKGLLYIGQNSRVNSYCEIKGNVVLGKNSFIGERCILHNCVILDHVEIGDDVFISNSIIGNGCKISNKVAINSDCVISDNNRIERQVELLNGVKIWPGKRIVEDDCVSQDLVG